MAGGLAALLDDVAMIAKMASAASTKAVGVVVDDAAVTPQYVQGFSPARELPIIWKIAKGSLVNKAILIVALLLLDSFLPVVLTPLLMVGGLYLSFEGVEKLIEAIRGGHGEGEDAPVVALGVDHEKSMVKGAITTDFILSAEIMVSSLNAVNAGLDRAVGVIDKAATLAIVAVLITLLVYGTVAFIVKMDDIGLHLSGRENSGSQKLGRGLVAAMPQVLNVLSTVGIAAMLWVGGHILLSGTDKLGWHGPYSLVHHLAEPVHGVPGVGGFLAWLVETLFSALIGVVVGSVLVGIVHLFHIVRHDPHELTEAEKEKKGH